MGQLIYPQLCTNYSSVAPSLFLIVTRNVRLWEYVPICDSQVTMYEIVRVRTDIIYVRLWEHASIILWGSVAQCVLISGQFVDITYGLGGLQNCFTQLPESELWLLSNTWNVKPCSLLESGPDAAVHWSNISPVDPRSGMRNCLKWWPNPDL